MSPLDPDWNPADPEHSDELSVGYLRRLQAELAVPAKVPVHWTVHHGDGREANRVEHHLRDCPTLVDPCLRCRCE